ncbi:unnamed protein product [Angiostrongylus costaricensis]|uniref:Uncharacterized protein n=1 Tax=Angiostrongylus costaricensis TaxID=334426 RepID=A0A0R3PHE2_ANGCS|nr:unnamed protein product [Angiostrongylus costaricensis]
MFIAALAVFVCTTYAQYPPPPPYPPKPSPPYDGNSGASMSAGSFSSSYYPKPPYGPTYYPEHPAFHEFLYPRRHYSRSSPSSREYYCDYCPRVKLSCKNSPECFKPTVKYLQHHCKAIVTCDSFGEDVQLLTNDNEVLSEGLGISKLIQCKRGKWTAKDIFDSNVRFKGLRCVKTAPNE